MPARYCAANSDGNVAGVKFPDPPCTARVMRCKSKTCLPPNVCALTADSQDNPISSSKSISSWMNSLLKDRVSKCVAFAAKTAYDDG